MSTYVHATLRIKSGEQRISADVYIVAGIFLLCVVRWEPVIVAEVDFVGEDLIHNS